DRCLDPRARRGFLHAAEQLLMREMPVCPVFTYSYRQLCKPHVHGVFLSATGQIDFKWASVDQARMQDQNHSDS
ncbi:MAG: hypothetical protein KDK78_04145, partial [Chlamydiia bacterium]|nr:hypothetical protein [Chlamydiia bacterium]